MAVHTPDLPRRITMWISAVLLTVLLVPLLIAAVTFTDEAPIRVEQPAPRSVVATERVVLIDEEETELARRTAAESVQPILVLDPAAQAATVRDVRAVFDAVVEARRPVLPPAPEATATPSEPVDEDGDDGPPPDGDPVASPTPAPTPTPTPTPTIPSSTEQLRALRTTVLDLDDDGLLALIRLSNTELARVEDQAVEVAQVLARQQITEDELPRVLNTDLQTELALQSWPGGIQLQVVEPLLRAVLRPTLVVDPDATAAARERAREDAEQVFRTWEVGEVIVADGEIPDALEVEAVAALDQIGTDPIQTMQRAAIAMALVVLVVALYLRQMQPRVWKSARRLLALATIVTGYTVLAAGVGLLVDAQGVEWWYATPVGALAMLAAIMISPVAGVVTIIPAATILLLLAPGQAAPLVFTAVASLASVPMVSHLASRGDLRRATLWAVLAYPAFAVVIAVAFGGSDGRPLVAALAGAVNGIGTAMLVQGTLPALETIYRLPTVTALLDLADRNHPLLRRVEQEALGTYNHSVMVANLTERACREIGADPLIGQVSGLYHDVGKVKQPHFFIENQRGIANPHDNISPQQSARILHDHLTDGVAMCHAHRLPHEIIDCIGSHHGTMLVGFFYSKALEQAEGTGTEVDACLFRYPGVKPRSKEAAILFICDSSEAATRSAAMAKGTLTREEIAGTVDYLIAERMDDGQFDECDLTFRELGLVRDSVVEALVGIYHPRIAYPRREDAAAGTGPAPTPLDAPEETTPAAVATTVAGDLGAADSPNGNGSTGTAKTYPGRPVDATTPTDEPHPPRQAVPDGVVGEEGRAETVRLDAPRAGDGG